MPQCLARDTHPNLLLSYLHPVLRMKPGASCLAGECSPTELQSPRIRTGFVRFLGNLTKGKVVIVYCQHHSISQGHFCHSLSQSDRAPCIYLTLDCPCPQPTPLCSRLLTSQGSPESHLPAICCHPLLPDQSSYVCRFIITSDNGLSLAGHASHPYTRQGEEGRA